MQVTAPSTSELETKLAASLSPAFTALALSLFDELQRYRDATAGRAAGAADRNTCQGRLLRDKIAAAADLVPLHLIPRHQRVAAVVNVLMRYSPAHFGLASMPDPKTLRRVVKEIIDGK